RLRWDGSPRTKIAHGAKCRRVTHAGGDHRTLRLRAKEPGRSDESRRVKAMGFKILLGLLNQVERFVIPEVEKLAFIHRVYARDDFRASVLVAATRALMKEPVNDNLVSVCGEFL